MARLTGKKRNALPKKAFGLPGAKGKGKAKGKYPMPDNAHAANAKARAKQQLNKGNLSQSQYGQIVAKANKKLGQSGAKKKSK